MYNVMTYRNMEALQMSTSIGLHTYWNIGPISLMIFLSQFEFNGNFFLLKLISWSSDQRKFMLMSWQHRCHDMKKNLKWLLHEKLQVGKLKFSSNFNCDGKIVSGMGATDTLTQSSVTACAAYSQMTYWLTLRHLGNFLQNTCFI